MLCESRGMFFFLFHHFFFYGCGYCTADHSNVVFLFLFTVVRIVSGREGESSQQAVYWPTSKETELIHLRLE